MSASSKKKLRNAEKAEQLTERQLAEQKEAKKLKTFSIVMVVIVAAMIVFAVYTAISKSIEGSGVLQQNTTAVTVGDHEISAVEYNCFYIDAVSQFYSVYGSYASLVGLDVTTALDQQQYDEETTWADYFKTMAEDNIKTVYAIVDEAEANGFALTEEDQEAVDSQMSSLTLSALYAGYTDVASYLTAMYGTGANEDNVRDYAELCYTATMYQQYVSDSLAYTADDIRAEDEADPTAYTYYNYNSYYMTTSKFLEGGTTAEDGTTTYSDEEKAAAVLAAEEAAKTLTAETITSVEALDAAIAALSINAEATSAASTPYSDITADYIASGIHDWVIDTARQEGDLTYIPSTSTADDGTETINGYYVVYFVSINDNKVQMQNVRHILAAFEGGTTDDDGNTTYSDEEKAAALEEAEAIYAEWKAGDATEDSFAALANEKSDDGDGTTGGLYTDIYPGQMVSEFEDWCFDTARKAGDTEIVETTYGYHIMYYVGAAEQNYRDYMIENTLRSRDLSAWLEELAADLTVTAVDYKYVPTGMVLSSSSSY